MNRLGWWLADKLSQSLERHERDAVRGDQSELGTSGVQASREVLGLVIRRQLQLWKSWRPWLAVLGIVLPFGLFLSAQTLSLDHDLAPATRSLEFVSWRSALGYPLLVVVFALPLGLLSWSSGYAIGSFSGRTLRANVALLFLVWLGVVASWLAQPGAFQSFFRNSII